MNPSYGGPCQGVRNLIPAMDQLGSQSEVISFDEPNNDFSSLDPFPVHCLGPGKGPWSYNGAYRPWLERNASNYDVIVIHGDWLYQSIATIKAIQSLRKQADGKTLPKVFAMPHGMLDPWFQRDPSRRLKAIRNWVYWKLIEHRVISDSDGVLFTCHRELELARIPFRPYRPKCEIDVGYGIPKPPDSTWEMDAAFRKRCPQLKDRQYLLYLSRIDPKKGIDLLIRAYAKVTSGLEPGRSVPALVVAGPDDSYYAKQMKALVAELGLQHDGSTDSGQPAVIFTGMLKGDAKWGAFYGCQAFVLPSHQENFGIAVAEALACGAPVLISDQVNICVEIKNARAGMVSADTFDGTCQTLERWLGLLPTVREKYSDAATACYEQHFAVDRAAAKFYEAIQ
ncbi:glycosyltransferase [Stieleria sp. JC731]|nr:glycosyltransferase [Stieleria sp. JC731]MCC9599940.1 glycosyltransferase [Stieleria sp. JC731]